MSGQATSSPAFYEERIRLLQNLYDELFAQTELLRGEAQRLREVLERVCDSRTIGVARHEARNALYRAACRAALDGTPSAAQTLEDPQTTGRAEAS